MVSKSIEGGILGILGCSIIIGGFALLASAAWVDSGAMALSKKLTIVVSGVVALFLGAAISFASAVVLDKNKESQKSLKLRKSQEIQISYII